jgi:steroid Delta-isomerase
MDIRAAIDRYARFYETMTLDALRDIETVAAPNVRFKDPFNDVTGPAAMAACLAMAYRHGTPRFEVLDRAASERAGYLLWRYTSTPQGAVQPNWVIEGMSELRFAEDGRVVEHIDHWDSGEQFYRHLPLIGWLIGKIRKRLSLPAS